MISTFTALMWIPYILNELAKNRIRDTAPTSAAAFFWARIVHALTCALGIPWLRTLSFAVARGGIICIAWQVLQ